MFCGIIIRVIIQHSQKVDEYKREPCQGDLRTQSPISWNSNKGAGRVGCAIPFPEESTHRVGSHPFRPEFYEVIPIRGEHIFR